MLNSHGLDSEERERRGAVRAPVFTTGMFEEMSDEDRPRRQLGDLLTVLCAQLTEALSGKRRERLRRAESDLRRCIEDRTWPLLTDGERVLAELERDLGQSDPVGRAASADVLIPVLVHFLDDGDWGPVDDEDRRVRIRLVSDLAFLAVQQPELRALDLSCSLIELQAAQRRARRRLREDQRARRLAHMDPALRAQIEQQAARPSLGRAAQ